MKTTSCFVTPLITSIILLCGVWTPTVAAATPYIFVSGECGNDAWSGKYSQCSAPDGYKRTIQAALNAIPDGGNIVVRAGTYSGQGNRDLDFHGKAVQIYGYDCIIDCGGIRSEQHRAFHFYSGETESSIVQGFTITNGMAWKGGAVLCANSSPKFLNCTFQANEATDDDTGGGAVFNDDSSPTFESCTFADNIAMPSASYGGAITNEASSPTLTDCTFSNNHAWSGGGMYNRDNSNPALENCTFSNNQAVRGAGMGNSGSSPILSRCTFTGNSASYYGGGIYNSFGSNPTLTHCTFTANSAIDGGGIANWDSSPAVINCLFVANSATSHGGAVSNDGSFTQLVNCTIYGNSAPNGGGIAAFDDSRVTTANCILWGNTPAQVYDDDPACNQILFSCVEGGWSGAGNTAGDPLLADTDGPDNTLGTEDDDFSLTIGSACIDAGKNSVVPPTLLTDLAGLARFSDDLQTPDTGSGTPPVVDMGVREFQGLFYVDDTAVGANNGTSWADAFTSLQDALAAASSAEIHVAQGSYRPDLGSGITPGNRQATFELFSDLTLRGGYAGFGAPDPDARNINDYPAILTGDLAGNDTGGLDDPSREDNSIHVVTISETTESITLDGLTITAGNANGTNSLSIQARGAGIYQSSYDGATTMIDCRIIANHATGYGAGMWSAGTLEADRCKFLGNKAEWGGGLCNRAEWATPARLTNCLFSGNVATYSAGALATFNAALNCTNCTFTGNRAEGDEFYRGGAIAGDDDTDIWLTNCILWGNTDIDGATQSSQLSGDGYNNTEINYCCVQGWSGILGGEGNFANAPLFIDADGTDNKPGTDDDDTRLAAGSPCINSGDPDFEPFPGETDLDGYARVIGPAVDVGAYENRGGGPGTNVIYVDDSAAGANNGSSWANAFKYLQDALAAASAGDQILVAQGIYIPDRGRGITLGERTARFHPANGVTIKGGYAGFGPSNPDARDISTYVTILSGDLAGNDIEVADPAELIPEPTRAENSYNVVVTSGCDRTTLIEGFTITGGNGNGAMLSGAGIYHGKPTVSLCKILANSAAHEGGGIYFEHAAHEPGALLKDSIISRNAANAGGGVYGCAEVVNCTFTDNAAVDGHAGALNLGSDCETTVTDCIFSRNYAAESAGAVYLDASGTEVTFTRCTFVANSSGARGGAIYADGCTCGSYSTFYQCKFIGNNAGSDGGAICDYGFTDTQLYSCLLVGNSSGRNGGALCDEYDGGSALINCTVSGNTAAGQGGGVCYDNYSYKGRRLANTIIWANSDKNGQTDPYSQIHLIEVSELQDVTHCCIQVIPPEIKGQGNTTSDPLFVDADGPDNVAGNEDDNLHLLEGSPCVDTGHNEYVPQQSSDLDGNPRIINDAVDRGAYEGQGGAPPTGIIYVDDSATGANNGSSWANAFKTLQDALAAVSSGNEIRVAQGVYKPDQGAGITPKDRSATFRLKSNVTIKGGYAGLGEPAPDARNIELYHTILTGDLAGDDDAPDNPADLLKEPTRTDNSYHVVTATGCDRVAVLDGFTITAGNASGPTEAQKWGGGLYDGNPTVKNCIFINNSAGFGGGGIYFSGPYYNNNPGGLITDCTITHNAASIGGGIYGCSILSNCVISANAATVYSGGGVHLGQGCDTTVTDCVFSSNSAVTYGGGVSLGVSGSTPIFTRCTFIANSAEGSGGGVASDGCTCGTYPEFHRCAFIANSAGSNGGGLYNFGYALAKMYSCIVIGNTAGNNGGGICDGAGYDDGGSLIVNCTLTHNTASEQGGGIYYGTYSQGGRSIVNSILWHNSDRTGQSSNCSQICAADGTTTVLSIDYCCIQGWTGGGNGNIAKNPLFVDADGADNVPGTQDDNLHLQSDSPCIDKGRSSAVPPDSNDLDDNPRIMGGSVDMGAYEFVAAPEWTLYDVVDLGTLGGQESMAYAINNYGQIVGWASRPNHAMTACRFDFANPGNNLDLDPHGEAAGGARSINIHGDIVGVTRPDQDSPFYATLFNPSDPCDNLNLTDPCSYMGDAYSINDHGQIVGHIVSSTGYFKATLFDSADPNNNIDLSAGLANPQGNDMSLATSINNKGQIVGYALTGTAYGRIRAVLFDPTGAGNSIILTPEEDDGGTAHCINDAGQIVGRADKTNGATLFDPCDPGNNCSLGMLPGGRESYAYAINNRGQIVGSVSILVEGYTTVGHATIFDPTGAGNNRDLNDLIDKSLGWHLSLACGINDAGWIVGYGTNPHGNTRAFLLIPKNQKPALVAHWKLDEAEGSTAKDSAGDSDGILHGPQWQPYSGRLEGALLFDGENDYVNCGSDSAFDISGQITVAAWANFSSVNMEWQTVIAKGDSAWRLSTARNFRRYHFAVTGGPPWNYINGDIEVEAHEWHHVCGTYDGANLRLYIDGVEDPAGPVPELNGVTTDDYDVYIGENQERPGRYWDGLIDDARVYNYALTPAQVFNLCKPGVLYVDSDAPGANNGSSWADAFKCLQNALAAAANGTEIRVAQGTYRPDRGAGITPGDRQAAFQLLNGVAIKGGYAGFGTPHPDALDIEVYETILSGDLAGNDAEIYDPEQLGWEPTRSENAYHVVTGTQTNEAAVIDGFTITAGNANYYDFSLCNGPGMFNDHGSPTILNCTFIANFAGNNDGGGAGGAMFNLASHPTITNCTFVHNAAIALDGGEGSAGAVFNENSSPRIADCTFIGNVAGRDGGAMYNYGSNPTLTNCEFIGNLAREGGSGSYGGAVWNYGSNPVLTNCLFTGNKAGSSHIGSGGGAIGAAYGSVTIINCTFNGNVAEQGGAIYGDYEASFSLANCILWNDKPDEIYTRGTTPVMKYCDVQNGSPGEGNLNADPCFVAPGHWDSDLWIDGDYHLRSAGWRWDAAHTQWTFDRVTSRCIDAGNPGSPLADEPLTIPDDPNNDWGCNLRIDMGAYGGTAEAGIPPYDWALLADLNNDGAVDWLDFVCTGSDWLKTGPHQPCDLDRSGDAGLPDLGLFADDWLKTTIWRK